MSPVESQTVPQQGLGTPRVVAPLLATFRQRLIDVGFTDEGNRGTADTSDAWSLASRLPAADASPFSTLATLFWLGAPVDARQAQAALEPLRLVDLEALGVADVRDGQVRPLCTIRATAGLLVASDLAGQPDPVLGHVPASETLARLTIRRHGRRALDLGSGCGVQSLLLARHCDEVISVDVNPRALAFTAFTAALNGATNIEVREGSWFAPVAGDRFDVIACNPPYVISPDTTFTYRDGGLPRDGVCRMVVREIAQHLADDGFATILCNWVYDDSWSDPLRSWVEGIGCDALLLRYATVDPATYAANWNAESRRRDPAAFETTVRRWVDYYAAERIARIGLGGVILRRRRGADHWVRPLDMATGPSRPSSDDIVRLFDTSDFLARCDGDEIFQHAYAPLEGHRIDQALEFDAGRYAVGPAVYRRVPGIGIEAHVDAAALEVLLECDGRRLLGDVVADTAERRGETVAAVRTLVAGPVRRLIESGFFVPMVAHKEGEDAC